MPPALPPDAFLAVHFVDVGQGDAIWVRTHDDGVDGNGTETVDGQPANIMLRRGAFEPIDLGSEVSTEILYSYPGDPKGLGAGGTLVNDASIVLRIEYGEYSSLFMDDLVARRPRFRQPRVSRACRRRVGSRLKAGQPLVDVPQGSLGLRGEIVYAVGRGNERMNEKPR